MHANFKKLKALVADIQKEIKVDNKLNLELSDKFNLRLAELEQVK